MTTSTPLTADRPAGPATDFDTRAFRNALGSFPTGVAIITTVGEDGRPIGLTCNSFSSVSLEPPLVSWGLRTASKSLETFRQSGAFAINILAEDQKELSARFASGAIVDKFEGVAWTPGHRGLPVIAGSVATFECDKFAEHLAGDHVLFLGQVARFDHGRQEASLVFYKGAYMMLTQSLRELAASGRLDSIHLDQARRLINCMLLRLACQNGSAEDFDAIERNIGEIERYDDAAQRAEASIEFFRLVTKAAHNEVLVVVAETLTTLLRHVLQTDATLRARPDLVPVRRKILAHMRERDPDAAESEMSHYFDELRRGAMAAQEVAA
ncbi:flavin reductase [Xenophilus arseniciresistens]|uniref:Flavin reductase n=1 Tax=Xenophilus arseniciresistens TaxID=1283306 RepID=A0AAE3T1A4_9BURK|nr:flavin reductase [Xenophilus arseniciresistens]MDA7419014.1 flavin reductase [Xenophilus arseniciresistens]